MMICVRRAVLPALLVAVAVVASGGPPRLLLDVEEGQEAAAREIEAMPPERLELARQLTGLADVGGPVRVSLRSESSREARLLPDWVAGYARGETGEVVLFPSRGRSWPDRSLESLLVHELTHVLVARSTGGRAVPRWFNEGVALAASGAATVEDQTRFLFERLRTGRVPLAQLDLWFQGGPAEVRRAYAVAGALVREIIRRHGPGVVARILGRVRSGEPFAEAYFHVTGEALSTMEERFWQTRGGFLHRYLPFLTSSLALWMLGALLVLIAVWRRRQKTKELEAKWEAQGLGEEPGPEPPETSNPSNPWRRRGPR